MRALLRPLAWLVFALAAFALPLNGCGPSGATPLAAAEVGTVSLTFGPGDTLTVTAAWRTVGAPDSVIWSVSSPPSVTQRRAYLPGPRLDSLKVVPSPALADGDSLTLSSCLQVATKRGGGVAYSALKCQSLPYTKPGVVFDSLRVVGWMIMPKAVTVAATTQQQFCALWRRADGSAGVAAAPDGSLDPDCLAEYGSASQSQKALLAKLVFGKT